MLLSITTVVFCHLVSHQYVWSVSQQLLVSLQLGSPTGILALFSPIFGGVSCWDLGTFNPSTDVSVHFPSYCIMSLSADCSMHPKHCYHVPGCVAKIFTQSVPWALSTVVKRWLYGLFLC